MSDFYDYHARRAQAAAISRAVVVVSIVIAFAAWLYFHYQRDVFRSACIHDGIPPAECERIFP